MQYLRTDHYLLDLLKKNREFLGSFYGTRELRLDQKRLMLSSPDQLKPKVVMSLSGADLLNFETWVDGQSNPISRGRFLNSEYGEMIFQADLPEKGLHIDGVVSKVSEVLFVSTKTLKDIERGEIVAIAQEIIHLISKEAFEKST